MVRPARAAGDGTTLRSAKLFSSSYEVSEAELADLSDAIRRRGGAAFMHRAAGFVAEHRRHAKRWDLAAIARELQDTVAFHLAGSEEDRFEPRQIDAARERLAPFGRGHPHVRWWPSDDLRASSAARRCDPGARGRSPRRSTHQPGQADDRRNDTMNPCCRRPGYRAAALQPSPAQTAQDRGGRRRARGAGLRRRWVVQPVPGDDGRHCESRVQEWTRRLPSG